MSLRGSGKSIGSSESKNQLPGFHKCQVIFLFNCQIIWRMDSFTLRRKRLPWKGSKIFTPSKRKSRSRYFCKTLSVASCGVKKFSFYCRHIIGSKINLDKFLKQWTINSDSLRGSDWEYENGRAFVEK